MANHPDSAPDPLPELKEDDFALDHDGKTDKQRTAALNQLRDYLYFYRKHFLGYQVNQDLQGLQEAWARF